MVLMRLPHYWPFVVGIPYQRVRNMERRCFICYFEQTKKQTGGLSVVLDAMILNVLNGQNSEASKSLDDSFHYDVIKWKHSPRY